MYCLITLIHVHRILQLDMTLLCGALVLLGLFKVIPLESSLGVRIVYAGVLGVVSGIYLGTCVLLKRQRPFLALNSLCVCDCV